MKKYEVTLYYHTDVTVEVVAENKEMAIAQAYLEVGDERYDAPLLHNIIVDGDPDVEEITED